MNKLIILCAGHGQGDPGVVGQGTNEAAQTVDIVNRTADKLRADGQVAVHIVPHEKGLIESIKYVNDNFKNLEDGYALEVHKNCCSANGVEVWYWGGDSQSQAFAQAIQNGLKTYGGPDRGVKPDTSNRHGKLGWIRETNPWAGLAEVGFINESLDNDMWSTALMKGVLNLWSLSPKPVEPPKPVPAPEATWNYRVTNLDGKQIGVYKEKGNAWNKYQSVQGSARIYDKSGADVTGAFVEEFRPKQEPVEPPRPEPTLEERVSRLEGLVDKIWAYLMKWKRFRDFVTKGKKDE